MLAWPAPRAPGNRSGFERHGGAERSAGVRRRFADAPDGAASAAGWPNEPAACCHGRDRVDAGRIPLPCAGRKSAHGPAGLPHGVCVSGGVYAVETRISDVHLRWRVPGRNAGRFGLDRRARPRGNGNAGFVCHHVRLAVSPFPLHRLAVPRRLCAGGDSHVARRRVRWKIDAVADSRVFRRSDSGQSFADGHRHGGASVSGRSHSAGRGPAPFLVWNVSATIAGNRARVQTVRPPFAASDDCVFALVVRLDDAELSNVTSAVGWGGTRPHHMAMRVGSQPPPALHCKILASLQKEFRPRLGGSLMKRFSAAVLACALCGGAAALIVFAHHQVAFAQAPAARPIGKPVTIKPPLGLPPVPVPADNPPTAETIALGRRLYYDTGLSIDGTVSCATCHSPTKGFTDNKPVSNGVQNKTGTRNSPTVINSAYSSQIGRAH